MNWKRVTFAAFMSCALTVFAERPPASGHAPAEFFAAPDGVSGATPGARFLGTLPYAARDTLRKEGRVLLQQKGKAGLVRAVIRFERPVDEVFAIITRPSEQASYMPHVTESKAFGTSTAEGEAIDTVVTFLFVTLRYRTQHWFYPEEHRMEWNLDPAGGKSLKDQDGYFQLYALDPRTTIAEYGTRVVAEGSFIDFIRGLGERGGVDDALNALRKHVAAAKD